MSDINFRREIAFEYGTLETVSPLVRRLVARNPGPFTFNGTATFVVGRGRVAVIDPGPALDEHIAALLKALEGETADCLLITHTHRDHSPAAAAVKRATGAATYGFGPHGTARGPSGEEGADHAFVPDRTIRDGDEIDGPGWHIRAVHTPGHTSNHLCYALAEESLLFSGDHVMGWSTSVISPPDGDMAAYMRSLEKLLARDDALYMPTHGPAIPDPKPYVASFIAHRRERAAAIRSRLAAGDRTVGAIVDAVYVGLPANLHAAAARSVLAHLIELVGAGEVESEGPPSLDSQYRLCAARA
jgi:glyoxylase-like metal-dependent hydrolase (beta-lactamase superfamily II)